MTHDDVAWHERHERHRQLADRTVRAGEALEPIDDLVERVADMLDDLDDRRVPIETVAAAYQRGRREVIKAVRDEIAAPAAPESDVEFGLRLLRVLGQLEGALPAAARRAADRD